MTDSKREAEKMPPELSVEDFDGEDEGTNAWRVDAGYRDEENPERIYIRSDLHASALARIASLEAALREIQKALRDGTDGAALHKMAREALSTPTQEEGT